ncbi:MAG: 1-(5-phosphoribosyl)-5-[(5-phosphoribosylamino)methylideneamino]imidazole-4-carboxamide isomerase [Solirubrobacteraceae bacterium]
MNLYPAIDILGGNAVRLVRGDFEASKTYDAEPLSAARAWVAAGARYLHVVDLDGARAGEPVNLEHLRRIAAEAGAPVQYGGGLRTAEAVEQALGAGAARVILGTAAMTDPDLLRDALAAHGPDRVLVAVDVRDGEVSIEGWTRAAETPVDEVFAGLIEQGVRRLVYTNVDRDGMLGGVSLEDLVSVARAAAGGSLIYSGGIGRRADLESLVALRAEHGLDGLDGVIVGTALYEGRFTVAEALAALAG